MSFRNGVLGASYLPVKIVFHPKTKRLHPKPTKDAKWIRVCGKKDKQCEKNCKDPREKKNLSWSSDLWTNLLLIGQIFSSQFWCWSLCWYLLFLHVMKICQNIEIYSFRISYRIKLWEFFFVSTVYAMYSYLEKSCRRKCTQQSRMANCGRFKIPCSSNGTKSHGSMFASA